jgi:polyisoprenyl-phosphate glycosyltransferase
MKAAESKTILLFPLFNDWKALEQLLSELHATFQKEESGPYEILIVNDGSIESKPAHFHAAYPVRIVNLTHNIGHQKALAVGLSYIHHNMTCDHVLIMDADGDDRPADAVQLLKAAASNPGKIVVGWRSKRNDSPVRTFFYSIYLMLFRLLTGKQIRFGNFCVLPSFAAKRLIYKGDVWLHLPGSIIKSRIPYETVQTSKGARYHQESKMNFTSLLFHGMGALAAFIDIIAIRLLIASGIAITISLLCLVGIFIIKTATNLGIPGWASLLGSTVIVIILLSFLIALFLIFTFLMSQSYRKFIPALHYKEFIDNVENLVHELSVSR